MPRITTPDLDLNKLYEMTNETTMQKQASSNKLKLAENQARFTKIAFDLFRDTETEFVWKLEKDSETGDEYIIRTAEIDPLYKNSNEWSTQMDSEKTTITLVYKGNAIKAFKKADVQFNDENVDEWRRFLIDKIQTDPSFLKNVTSQLGENRRKYIFSKFPELNK